ncbi:LysE family translocator [Phytoactinopolyspora mesophila]|uniref:LysE family translocator n=1 Tax=Phytoactinopolyspora mesophila TaxID=2650750 RepID=A0A7K3M4M2_9ACTN|nr:LysE family transporter [Phytoactinopolyspora mesophila]NDL58263.1 LysE family translocator [Phytoactinopolyspora mesophila]
MPTTPSSYGNRSVHGSLMFPDRWLPFVGVLLLVLCTPGPDFLVVLRHSLSGPSTGYRAVGGVVTGLTLHTMIAVVGLAAIIAAHPPVFHGVRLAGAAYLTWLGIASLRSFLARRRSLATGGKPDTEQAIMAPAGHPFRDGVLTNTLNPKAILFFVGLLPQFVTPGSSVVGQIVFFAVTTIMLAAIWLTLLVQVIGKAMTLLNRPSVRSSLDALTAAAFFGLAASLTW